ncbi:MAG: alpha/beta hydrolase [Xanthobacteraceae bacterium]
MHRKLSLVIPAALLALLSAIFIFPDRAPAQSGPQVVNVEVRPGVNMRYLAVPAAGQAKAAVILLAGGNGALKLSPTGSFGDLSLNFLIRTRDQFARQGLAVAALDAAADHQGGMNGKVRMSAEYAQDVSKVIADIKKRTGVPVWLIGTSAGTLSAASVGARGNPAPDGIVLTSTMTTLDAGHCGMTVYNAPLATIKRPVLVVSHKDDGCACSPGKPEVGAKLIAALSAASAKEFKLFTGGSPPRSAPCDANSQHGYLGIEGDVVKMIADWIKAH